MKKQISAEIIADSLSPQGHRLTTYVVTFPRIVLAEFNTHRMFSRNSASSRAVPFERMMKMVMDDPFIPIAWQKDHPGMQGTEYIKDKRDLEVINSAYLLGRNRAVEQALYLSERGVTKQIVNRPLEAYMWHTAIVTAHEYENFFHLRCPQYSLFSENMPLSFRSRKDFIEYVKKVEAPEFKNQYDNLSLVDWLETNKGGAEIHISVLAELMWDAYNESTPKQLLPGEWHIPFGSQIDNDRLWDSPSLKGEQPTKERTFELSLKIASARCARVSYINYEGKDDYEADFKLFDRLIVQEPIHASPIEHCGRAMSEDEYVRHIRGIAKWEEAGGGFSNLRISSDTKGWSGNFRGFIQYRKMFPNENKI